MAYVDLNPIRAARDNLPSFGALGPVSMLKVFAKSVGRKFIKGHAFGQSLCPERV